jgi:hypothetical protein
MSKTASPKQAFKLPPATAVPKIVPFSIRSSVGYREQAQPNLERANRPGCSGLLQLLKDASI